MTWTEQVDAIGMARRCAWCNRLFAQSCKQVILCSTPCAKAWWSWHLERFNGDWKLGLTDSPPKPLDTAETVR